MWVSASIPVFLGLAFAALAQAWSITFDGRSIAAVTYWVFYSAAGACFALAAVFTVLAIRRRKARYEQPAAIQIDGITGDAYIADNISVGVPVLFRAKDMKGNLTAERNRAYEAAPSLQEAIRTVAEDELNGLVRPRVEALAQGRGTGLVLATAQWSIYGDIIKRFGTQAMYEAGATAYRSMIDLHEGLSLEERTEPLSPMERDAAQRTLEAVERAIAILRSEDAS